MPRVKTLGVFFGARPGGSSPGGAMAGAKAPAVFFRAGPSAASPRGAMAPVTAGAVFLGGLVLQRLRRFRIEPGRATSVFIALSRFAFVLARKAHP